MTEVSALQALVKTVSRFSGLDGTEEEADDEAQTTVAGSQQPSAPTLVSAQSPSSRYARTFAYFACGALPTLRETHCC